jgi:hypothetical protein
MPETGAWMRANLTTQGYCLSDEERQQLAVGLRFSQGRDRLARRRRDAARRRGDDGRASVKPIAT